MVSLAVRSDYLFVKEALRIGLTLFMKTFMCRQSAVAVWASRRRSFQYSCTVAKGQRFYPSSIPTAAGCLQILLARRNRNEYDWKRCETRPFCLESDLLKLSDSLQSDCHARVQ